MESLRSVQLPILGVVVNNVSADGVAGYGTYGYGYGYGTDYGYGAEPDPLGDESSGDVREEGESLASTTQHAA